MKVSTMTRILHVGIFALALAWWHAVCAADRIVVGTGDSLVTNVAVDVVNSSDISLSDRSTLKKDGAGKWTLKTGQFARNVPVEIQVREGSLALERSAAPASYPEPTAILSGSLLHFDASCEASVKRSNGTDVEEWHDVRETGDGSSERPFLYIRAVTNFQCSSSHPSFTSYKEKPGVYFQGFGNGVWMNWILPDGGQATCGNLRNIFIVHSNGDGNNTWGHALGQRAGQTPCFQRGNSSIWQNHSGDCRAMHAARTFVNGAEIDPFSAPYSDYASKIMVVEVECLGDSLSTQCFYNDRDMQVTWPDGTQHKNAEGKNLNPILGSTSQTAGGDRVGGGFIHEVILFDCQLSQDQRMAVADWLNQKWNGIYPSAEPEISVVMGTNAEFFVSGEAPVCKVSGDGELVKVGAETMRIAPALCSRSSEGLSIRVAEGAVSLGSVRPVKVTAGTSVNSSFALSGTEVSAPTSEGDSARFVKRGDASLTIDSVPTGIRQICVEGGELVVSDPERRANAALLPAPSALPLENGTFGFEEFHETGNIVEDFTDKRYGWTPVIPATTPGKANSGAFFFDASHGQDRSGGWNLTIAAKDGSCSLCLKNNASAWAKVYFPESGVYTYTVWVAGRNGQTGVPMRLLLGKDEMNLEEFGILTRTDGSRAFRKFVFTTPYVEAGDYQFWIKAPDAESLDYDKDKCYQYDAMSFTKNVTPPGAYAIPNGDFETWVNGASMSSFSLGNVDNVVGFTVKQADDTGTATGAEALGQIHAYTTFSVANCDSWTHFNAPWNRPDSQTQFYFSGNGSELTTSFVPPAGFWRFQADACVWMISSGNCQTYDLAAKIRVGDGKWQTLGSLTVADHKLLPRIWPGKFAVDGKTTVSLTVTGSISAGKAFGHALIDNLALIPIDGQNILDDPSFENRSWEFFRTPKPENVSASDYLDYDSSTCRYYYTRDRLDGVTSVRIVNDDRVFRDVMLANAGLYRLTANMTTRCNPQMPISFDKGANPIAVYLARDGVTNWIGRTEAIATTNFNEYAYQFRVKPGEEGWYSVGFQGLTEWDGVQRTDRTSVIDGVMLCEFETEGSVALHKDIEIDVNPGAKLRLDFDGTNRISSLRIGGRFYSGLVSSETCPQLRDSLCGRGTLDVRRDGIIIFIW